MKFIIKRKQRRGDNAVRLPFDKWLGVNKRKLGAPCQDNENRFYM